MQSKTVAPSKNTVKIASHIQNELGVDSIAHLTCVSSTKEEVRQRIEELKANGIQNILALRGDIPKDADFPIPNQYKYAYELIEDIKSQGDFCIGAACYPEGHVESAHKEEDILHLKQKVDCGVDFLTSQMFFDNSVFYNFLYRIREKGITVSCDLNYRKKLWTKEKACQVMSELCKYVDVCISNEEDAKDVFGIEAENTDIYGGKLNKEGYKSVAKQLMDTFGFEKVAITLRSSISASDNDWAGMLYDGENYCFSKEYHLHIVDRVGGGDSFGGGLIYALLSGKDTQSAVEFAVAASALKHSIEGDYNFVTVDEVEKLAGGNASGRVQR